MEYDRLSKLKHPGIVRARAFGIQDGAPYLVTDYAEGICLNTWLREHRPSWSQTALLVASVADALAHAHWRGIVHRDVKPSNIILTAGLCPVLLDFGLSSTIDEVEESTPGRRSTAATAPPEHPEPVRVVEDLAGTSPLIVGTPAYMPPEQARGDGQRVDGKSDVYSLGVILYEMLCGQRAFPYCDGGVKEMLRRVIEDDPPPPRQLAPSIPRDLEAICLKAIAKRAADRYATAADLADDLRHWLAGAPITARLGDWNRPGARAGGRWLTYSCFASVHNLTSSVYATPLCSAVPPHMNQPSSRSSPVSRQNRLPSAVAA